MTDEDDTDGTDDETPGADPDECAGPHPECDGCLGTGTVTRATLYVGYTGEAQSVAAPHGCRHCASHGYICRAVPRCHPIPS
ncbi:MULTISPECIES: hypothetical protein [Streptomyces]|uniref:hypothetical protein n=1 Tax=Streptomyces TaxID=1883 RepID=UPI000CD5A6A8|nr:MULTISPECIES: hypothetical protein [Streptomyces]